MQFPLPEAATTTTTSSHTKWPAKILGKKQVESESPSHLAVSDSLQPHRLHLPKLLCPWNSPDNNTAVGSHSLLQGIFPTWGVEPGSPALQFAVWVTRETPTYVQSTDLEVHVLCAPSSSSFPPLECPIYSTSSLSFSLSLSRLFALTQLQCMLLYCC